MVPWSNNNNKKETFFTLQCTEVICVTDKSYKNSFEIYVASLSKKDKNISNTGLVLIASNAGMYLDRQSGQKHSTLLVLIDFCPV